MRLAMLGGGPPCAQAAPRNPRLLLRLPLRLLRLLLGSEEPAIPESKQPR